MRRHPNALHIALKRLNNIGSAGVLDSDEQRILARGYKRLQAEVKRLRAKITDLEAHTSQRIAAAYQRGFDDASRPQE